LKSRHKITLLFTLLVTAILLAVSISVYYFSALERQQIYRKRLTSRALNYAQIFSYFSDSSNSVLNRINTSSIDLIARKSVEIYDTAGRKKYGYAMQDGDSIGIDEKVISETIANKQYYYNVKEREALAVHYSEEGYGGIIVIVAGYDVDGWMQLKKLKQIFVFALLFGIVVILIAGHVFSKQLLKPVAQIIREVNDISSHNLSHRIQAGETQDELNQLANTFNELLDRLQESFTSQRRFISNASHELSTPLTSISSQLQVALQRNRTTDEYRQVMQSVQEDVMQMRELTKSLLEIAKTGAEGSIELNEIRIDEILFKVMGDMKKVNTAYQVELDFIDSGDGDDYGFLVFGNADLLYIAAKNLVENGCKYSSDNVARVDLSFQNGTAVIEVKSTGEPIAKEEMEKIFQPFYRSSNSAGKSGFGLGLALAKRIVGLHKGTLEVTSDINSGTSFIITLPTLKKKT
jgi:signal transduction histidine kinase